MTAVSWTIYWLYAQGYDVFEKSYIKTIKVLFFWEEKVKALSMKRKNHINIRYNFVTDRIENMDSTCKSVPHQT